MKLGFVLKITNGGESEAYAINKSESWARYAADARSAIKELSNFDETEHIVYLAKFLGAAGYLISVIKARPQGSGRSFDNTAAWIHFPANIDISNVEMIRIMQGVGEAISEKNGTDFEKLELLFSHEYGTNNALLSATSSLVSKSDAPFAIRYYGGDYNLHELMGNAIIQQEYGHCRGVFFVDQALDIRISSNLVFNFEPKRICTIQPLAPVNGFQLNFLVQNKYVPFDRPVEMMQGQTIEVFWCKKGYRPIAKTLVATQDNRYAQALQFTPAECLICVKRSMFYITDDKGREITNADIHIDQKKMIGDDMGVAEEAVHRGVTLLITAPGYADYKKDGVALQNKMNILLKKKGNVYEFVIPMYDGDRQLNDAVLTIATARQLKGSPLKGYTLAKGKIGAGRNKLSFNPSWMIRLPWIVLGAVIGAAITLLIWGACSMLGGEEEVTPPAHQIEQSADTIMQDAEVADNEENVSEEEPNVEVSHSTSNPAGRNLGSKFTEKPKENSKQKGKGESTAPEQNADGKKQKVSKTSNDPNASNDPKTPNASNDPKVSNDLKDPKTSNSTQPQSQAQPPTPNPR